MLLKLLNKRDRTTIGRKQQQPNTLLCATPPAAEKNLKSIFTYSVCVRVVLLARPRRRRRRGLPTVRDGVQ